MKLFAWNGDIARSETYDKGTYVHTFHTLWGNREMDMEVWTLEPWSKLPASVRKIALKKAFHVLKVNTLL